MNNEDEDNDSTSTYEDHGLAATPSCHFSTLPALGQSF
jgi:hypothetical protein